jgi:TRAP-type C4-dicarboxylate transport system substrate-binding protein
LHSKTGGNQSIATLAWPVSIRRTALAACLLAPLVLLSTVPAKGKELTLHIARNATPTTIHLALPRFGEAVRAGSDDGITIVGHPNSELNGLCDGVDGIRLGTINLIAADSGALGNRIPAMACSACPSCSVTSPTATRWWDGPIGAWMARELRKKMGLVLLGQSSTGFRVILSTKVPVNHAESRQGVKLRLPEIPV